MTKYIEEQISSDIADLAFEKMGAIDPGFIMAGLAGGGLGALAGGISNGLSGAASQFLRRQLYNDSGDTSIGQDLLRGGISSGLLGFGMGGLSGMASGALQYQAMQEMLGGLQGLANVAKEVPTGAVADGLMQAANKLKGVVGSL